MTGGHLGDLLSALLDGELTPAALIAAESHVEGCADCAHELDFLIAVKVGEEMIRNAPRHQLRPGT